jgi:hypothetical protein
VPAPAAPPGRPLLLNRFQGSCHNQAGAGASAGGQKLPAAPRNTRREKLASALLDVGPARDRKQREIVECLNLLRMQPRFVEQFAIVGNSPVRVQNERSQPSVTKFLDIAAIDECSRLVLSEQSRESAAANCEIVVPADRAECRVLKCDGKMRIRAPVDGFQSVSVSVIRRKVTAASTAARVVYSRCTLLQASGGALVLQRATCRRPSAGSSS